MRNSQHGGIIVNTNGNNETALAVQSQSPAAPESHTSMVRASTIEPQSMAELRDFASTASKSNFFGMSAEQAMIVAMAGRDLGFSVTQALRAFHVIKGKTSLSADGMIAACLQHRGLCEYFRPIELTDKSATWETKRVGEEPTRYTFTIQDAERAGIVNDMYHRHPRRMLSARAKSYLARDIYPEILMGLVEDDEAREIAQRGAPTQYVEASHVEQASQSTDGTIELLSAKIDAANDENALRHIGKEIVEAKVDDDARKTLRAEYAKRRSHLAKHAKAQAPAVQAAASAKPAEPDPGLDGGGDMRQSGED